MSESALAKEVVAADEPRTTAEFIAFLEAASLARHPTGTIRRFNQGRAAGCVTAEFIVSADLPARLRVGLFAEPRTYAARIRFAHGSSTTDRDKDVRGMSISVADVAAENLTPGATTYDFVLNSHPVMMVAGPREFLALLKAVESGGVRAGWYFVTHPGAARIAYASRQQHVSHLAIPYWSTTPYLFGPDRAVKYVVRPHPSNGSDARLPSPLTDMYLHDNLARHLEHHEAWFDFMVQPQTDPEAMPIEDASIEWRADASPPELVARIKIPTQRVVPPADDAACELMSFNPWHAPADHRPLGSFNRARREIYPVMAALRRERAGKPPVI